MEQFIALDGYTIIKQSVEKVTARVRYFSYLYVSLSGWLNLSRDTDYFGNRTVLNNYTSR